MLTLVVKNIRPAQLSLLTSGGQSEFMELAKFIPNDTVEDYQNGEGDWELWSGVPIAMSPPAQQDHQRISGRIFRQLAQALEAAECTRCEVFYNLDWIVNSETVFRPDLMVVCGHEPSDFVRQVPAMVVEVLSASTRKRDLLYKRDHYERLGVRHYLTVDPANKTCTLLLNSDSGFQESLQPRLTLDSDCAIDFDPSRLFPS